MMRDGLRSGSKFFDTTKEDEGLERRRTAEASIQDGIGLKFVDGSSGTHCKLKHSGEEDDLFPDVSVRLERNDQDEECGEQSGAGKDATATRKRGRVVRELEGGDVDDKRKKLKQEDSDCQGRALQSSSLGESEGEKHFAEDGYKSLVLGIGVNGVSDSGTRTFEKTNEDEDLGGRTKPKLNEEFVGTESGSASSQKKRANGKDLDGHLQVPRRVLRSSTMRKPECEKDVAGEQNKVAAVETGPRGVSMCETTTFEVKEQNALEKELDGNCDGKTSERVKDDGLGSKSETNSNEEERGANVADFTSDRDGKLIDSGEEESALFADQNILLERNERSEPRIRECNVHSGMHDIKIVHNADDGREKSEKYGGTSGALVQKTMAKGKDLDGQMQIPGRRVLRSNTTARAVCEEGVGKELNDVSGVEIGANDCNRSEKLTSEVAVELLDEESCFGPPINNENRIKRKRGRPPKVLLEGENDAPRKRGRPSRVSPAKETDVLRMCGREPKVLFEGETGTTRKRGRPFKVSGSNSMEKIRMKHEKRVEVDALRKRGRPRKLLLTDDCSNNVVSKQVKKGKGNVNHKLGRPPQVWRSDLSERIDVKQGKKGKTSKHRRGRPRKDYGHTIAKTNEDAAFLHGVHQTAGKGLCDNNSDGEKHSTSKEVKYTDEDLEQQKAEPKAGDRGARKLEKQLVRDKIVEMLLGAGWTVEYRPREGRKYNDAVYVNPEGRTHWSVTLAYRVLKEHYDNGGGDYATCKPGFKFTPLSDEELEILRRVVSKVRCDKNKKKKDWRLEKQGLKKSGALSKEKWKKKLNKKRLGSQANPSGKMLKGRKKPNFLSGQGDLVGASDQAREKKHRKTHNTKRYALMVRNTMDLSGSNKGDGYVLYDGKRTVLSWMIELGGVLRFAKVEYSKGSETKTAFTGSITTDGIRCDCCGGTFTVPQFSNHAGGNYFDSYNNTCIEDGRSLLQCQLDSWLKQDEPFRSGFHFVDTSGADPNDDTCGICGDGGDLVCCDGCPSTFHQSCLGVEKFPSGTWHCIYCSCKFCGNACQEGEDNPTAAGPLLECCLCQEKYHTSCVQSKYVQDDDPILSFCGKNCQELNERLQLLLGVKHELEDGFSWTLVRRFDIGSDISLSGISQKVQCNSKVAVALQIMDECFLPMVDHRSGVNLIRNIVYNFGSNFTRLNYGSFLTIILERGDEMVSAASIRIHGNNLAEMPFIGTRYIYRRQGMCRRLLSAIKSALHSLNVEKLVIPAISELRETWTGIFGFGPLERSSSPTVRNMNMVVFPGVDMLQKPVLIHHSDGDDVAPVQGLKLNDSDDRRPARFDLNSAYEPNEHVDGIESQSLGLNDTSVARECSDLPHNPSDQSSLDQIGKDPGYVEKNNVNMDHCPPISVDDAGEKNGEVPEPAAVINERRLESKSNLEETVVDLNLTSHEDSNHISAQSMDYGDCGLASEAELSTSKAMHQGSETGVLSDGIHQPRSPMADNGTSLAAQTETLQVMGTDDDVDNGKLTQCSLEPTCSSSSGHGVGIHLPLVGTVRAMPQR
ncbi:unnamed protein product [Linum tenue]|uniref:PHD-type domain-containing protein n=1 Tax=Linum tenue TaxID=586396 RepID=A0AAV0MSX4_9ROSI|nr:unnamed protein product [Linum tenue]